MSEETLKNKTVKALAWNFVDKFGQQIVYMVTGIVLARILSQSDYGLTGMLAIFIALSNVLLDSGFGGALIKKQDTTQADYNAVFYFNVFTSIVLYALLFWGAPLIARYFEEPQLVLLSRVLFLSILFNAFNLIQTIILTKTLRFSQLAKLNFLALVLSSLCAVALAVKGLGVWALVAQTVMLSVFKSLLLWAFNPWRPSFGFSMAPLKEAFSFSSRMLLTGLINAAFNNIYSVIIGKSYNKVELGYYQLANKYQDIPVSLITNTFRTVALPVFSNVNTDNERLGRVLQKTNKSIAFILFPVVLGLCVIAEPLLLGLIGEKWLPSVPLFRILLLSGLFSVFAQVFNELFVAKGKSRTYLRVEIAKKVFLVLAIAATFRYGVSGLAAGWVAYSFAAMMMSGYYACRIITYPFFRFFRSVAPYLTLALGMAAVGYTFRWVEMNMFLRMGIQIVACGLFYAGGCVLFRLEISNEISQLLGKLKRRS